MPFITEDDDEQTTEHIESMYADIRPRAIDGPNPNQARIWEQYEKEALNATDVAIQMPTGRGKTLAGLGIAEWRRRKNDERVVYLCPTTQLVHQVVEQSTNKYGIHVRSFVGKTKEYDEASYAEWRRGEIIAVTNYSTLFSDGRVFSDTDVIILDDAHAGENYIAGMWSVQISLKEHEALFRAVTSIVRPTIPSYESKRIGDKSTDPSIQQWCTQVPIDRFMKIKDELSNVLDEYVNDESLKRRWNKVKDHLESCHMYVGAQEFLIRPLIPPTGTHSKFANAKQRIYMSATLGEGGELERITGRRNIKRLPQKDTRQVVGRRFFIFPTLSEDDEERFLTEAMRKTGRSLVLVPRNADVDTIKKQVAAKLTFPVFEAREIERSKQPFLSKEQAVAVVANRYDGIDFPNEECRLLVLYGLPAGRNLQERFLTDKMGSLLLFNERIRTRIIQAVSRCTREDRDYAAVIAIGNQLLDYLEKREGREFLHPELQGEIRFGTRNCNKKSPEELLELIDLFLAQGDEWRKANGAIIRERDHATPKKLPQADILAAIAPLEIDYVELMWRRKYQRALAVCKAILGQIQGDKALQGYRALWNYLAGGAALLASEYDPAYAVQVEDYFDSAADAALVAWPPPRPRRQSSDGRRSEDAQNVVVLDKMIQVMQGFGVENDSRYTPHERRIYEGLMQNEATAFESAHQDLGELLGYQTGRIKGEGSPDPFWQVDDSLVFVFEDHSDSQEDATLRIRKARQAATHRNSVRKHLSLRDDAEVVTVLISNATKIDEEAEQHVRDVYFLSVGEFRTWAYDALEAIRHIRTSLWSNNDFAVREQALARMKDAKIAPEAFTAFVKQRTASDALLRV